MRIHRDCEFPFSDRSLWHVAQGPATLGAIDQRQDLRRASRGLDLEEQGERKGP